MSEDPSSGQDSYQVFARKYRPRTFDDILGQDHVVQTLKNAIAQDRLAHAYLFVGPRGTGKTSTARILAKALNGPGGPKVDFDPDDPICREIAEGNSLDVLEIDGASNNGVEQVRELREAVQFAPSSGRYKIYYIDEVHMLSNAAFNALLKTLEEPPPHVKFIFATTEAQKILPTIISRCQRFDLRRIPANIISSHLLHIAKEEKIELSDSAAFAIAKGAEGGMRDAQSMLDQLVAFCGEKIEEADVLEIFGFNSAEAIAEIAGMLLNRDSSALLDRIHEQSEAGRDLSKLLADLITHFRHLLVIKVDPDSETGEIPPELRDILAGQQDAITTNRLLQLIDLLAETDGRMKWAPNKKLHLEIGLIKAIQGLGESSLDDVISLISGAIDASPGDTDSVPAAASAPAKKSAPPPASPPASTPKAQQPAPAPAPVKESLPDSPKPEAPAEKTAEASASPPPPADEPATKPQPAEKEAEPDAAAKPPLPEGPLEGDALWDGVRQHLIAERPLIETWLRSAAMVGQTERAFTIGFPAEQDLFRDSMVRHKDLIQQIVNRLTGQKLEVRLELSANLSVQPDPVIEPEEKEPEEEAVESDAKSDENAEADPKTPESESEDDIHNDPLIQKALDEFEGTVIEKK